MHGKAKAAPKATKKLDGIAHWLADNAKSWGIDITVWHACADSHRQSEMAAMGPILFCFVLFGLQLSVCLWWLQVPLRDLSDA